MPGPCNTKKKKQQQAKKARKALAKQRQEGQGAIITSDNNARSPSPEMPALIPLTFLEPTPELSHKPFIEDPGNGPRVKDMTAYLSSFFAPPPALDNPRCAPFVQHEVLDALKLALPTEVALTLWFNKTRLTGRVCPACQRLYTLGDVLPEHVPGKRASVPPPHVQREREISGLCSPECFFIAVYNFPGAALGAWGRMEDNIDPATRAQLCGPGRGVDDEGLGLLLRMTRLHDLGLEHLLTLQKESALRL